MNKITPKENKMEQEPTSKLTPEQIREEQAYTLGTATFAWGFTMTELYRVRHTSLAAFGCFNKFIHLQQLVSAATCRKSGVVSANNATVYSSTWLDLSLEPIVVDIPPIPNRYFTINYSDFYQKVENLSNQTIGRQGGSYAFVGPNWEGVLPAEVERVNIDTNALWIIGRTEVKGPDDLPNANAIQDQYALTALSEWRKGKRNTMGDNQYEEWLPYDVSDSLNWFAILNDGLRRNPPYGPDAAIVGLFESIGIGPDKAFDAAKLDPATARGLRRAVEVGRQIMTQEAEQRLGITKNNWVMIPNSIDYSTPSGAFDFLFRTAVSLRAQPGQDSRENFFNFAYIDADDEPLHGEHNYTIRFEKGMLPPVDAFWSITMYDHPAGFLVENPLDRYQIGTYDEMKYGQDGSLTIYLQSDSPGVDKESNWLPAPKEPLYLCLRLYNARSEALTFDWLPPAVQKA